MEAFFQSMEVFHLLIALSTEYIESMLISNSNMNTYAPLVLPYHQGSILTPSMRKINDGHCPSERIIHLIKVTGYLTDTTTKADHPRALAMQEQVGIVAKEKGGELRSLSLLEPGIAVLDIDGAEAEKFISAELSKLEGVTVSQISPFEMQLQKNRALQAKVNTKRENKAKKGATEGR